MLLIHPELKFQWLSIYSKRMQADFAVPQNRHNSRLVHVERRTLKTNPTFPQQIKSLNAHALKM